MPSATEDPMKLTGTPRALLSSVAARRRNTPASVEPEGRSRPESHQQAPDRRPRGGNPRQRTDAGCAAKVHLWTAPERKIVERSHYDAGYDCTACEHPAQHA